MKFETQVYISRSHKVTNTADDNELSDVTTPRSLSPPLQ